MTTLLTLALVGLAQAEAPAWNTLHSSEAKATSFLQSNWNRFTENYHPTYVLDDNPATAWVEGVEGHGEGQVLTLPVSNLRAVKQLRLKVRNGYQKSAGLLKANAAPRQVRVHILDASGARTSSTEATLKAAMGWQEIVVPVNGSLTAVELEVVTVHPGTRYKDTCISDVKVEVEAEDAYNAEAEGRKLAAAKGWIAERVQAAAYFAKQPTDYPFAITSVTYGTQTESPSLDARMDPIRARLDALGATTTRYAPSYTRKLAHPPEEAWLVEPVLQFFAPTNVAWFETDTELLAHETTKFDPDNQVYWEGESWMYAHHIQWADATKSAPAELVLRRRQIIEERGTYEVDTTWWLKYEGGHVAQMYVLHTGTEELGLPYTRETLVDFTHDAEGRITGWTEYGRNQEVDYSKAFDAQGNLVPNPPTTRSWTIQKTTAGS